VLVLERKSGRERRRGGGGARGGGVLPVLGRQDLFLVWGEESGCNGRIGFKEERCVEVRGSSRKGKRNCSDFCLALENFEGRLFWAWEIGIEDLIAAGVLR